MRARAHESRASAGAGARTAIGVAVVLLGVIAPALAQNGTGVRSADVTEIAPFRLTGVEGYVLGGYWNDADKYSGSVGGSSNTTLSNITGKAFLMTHSYVYHPNLLLLDLGAGPVFFRNGYSSDTFSGWSNRTEVDASARATFMRDKPYRGSVYYDRLNDSQAVGPAQSLLTQNTRYGFDAALLSPVTPVPLHVDGYRFYSKGFGTDQVIDENIDEVNFRAERSWGGLGDSTFRYQGILNDSRSGNLGLPIQATTSRTQRADLDTTLAFGESKLASLTNTISYYMIDFTSDQVTLADNSLFRFDLNYRAQPTDLLQTRLRYQFDATDQTGQGGPATEFSGRLNAFNAGATWQATPDLALTADALASINRSTAFDSDLSGVNASVNYRHALAVGEIVTNYSTVWFRRDQVAKEPVASIVGERLVLAGLAWYPLRRTQVIAGTVVVRNSTRTQTYVEGLDYILRVIGLTTEIQRLAAGAILDGQEVLVDYSVETGGTFAVTEWDNTIDLAWRYKQAFSVYGRYSDTSPRLTSGTPTAPLNPANEVMVGARADVPFDFFGELMTAGGLAEWTDRREVISPATRMLYEAYVESTVPLIARSGLRFGARQQRIEYELTPLQDVTQRTFTLRFWSRFRGGLTVYLDAMSNKDSGSPQVAREYRQASARAQWRIRQLLMSLRFDATKQVQADADHTHTRTQFDVRRDF
ncbi:MAG: hypothetical protein WBC37_12505 [Burkholderiaceae bacterium]